MNSTGESWRRTAGEISPETYEEWNWETAEAAALGRRRRSPRLRGIAHAEYAKLFGTPVSDEHHAELKAFLLRHLAR